MQSLEQQVGVLAARGERRVSPFTVPAVMPNAAAAALSMRHGLRGPVETVATACAAGTHAVGGAARLVADGRCDLVLAGGAESALSPTTLAGFTTMTALSASGVSRPFDAARDGFCIGEGAGVLVLEAEETARARGGRRARRGARRGQHRRRPPPHRPRPGRARRPRTACGWRSRTPGRTLRTSCTSARTGRRPR